MLPTDLANRFEIVLRRLLASEKLDLYAEDVSLMFEGIATNLLGEIPTRKGCYFDGVDGLTAKLKTPRKLEFEGEMWVGRNRDQWTEHFRATAADRRSTKQGFWITIWIGTDRAEGELPSTFGK